MITRSAINVDDKDGVRRLAVHCSDLAKNVEYRALVSPRILARQDIETWYAKTVDSIFFKQLAAVESHAGLGISESAGVRR